VAELVVALKGQDQLSGVLEGAGKKAGGLGNMMGSVLKVGALAGAAGIGVLAFAAVDFVKAAMADEASVAKLAKAVENTGVSWADYSGKLDASVTAAQKMAFSDDAARDSLALLMAQTGDADEAMRRFTLAQDIARGAGIDLEMSSKLLGKVTEENVDVFKKMGVNLEEGASEAEAFAALQAKFGGQAEVYAKSTAGQFAQVGIQLGELKEKIGYALLPVALKLGNVLLNVVVPALSKVADIVVGGIGAAIKGIQPIIEGFLASWSDPDITSKGLFGAGEKAAVIIRTQLLPALQSVIPWLQDLAKVALEIGQNAIKFLTPALDTLADLWANALRPALEAIMPYLKKVGDFLGQHKELIIVGAAAILLLVNPWLAVAAAIAVVLAKWDEISKFFSVDVPGAIDTFLDKIGEIPIIGEIFKGAFEAIKTIVFAAWELIYNRVETAINAIRDIITIVTALIHGDWEEAWNGVKDLVADVWAGIKTEIELTLGLIKDLLGIYAGTFLSAVKDGWTLVQGFFTETIPNWFKNEWKDILIGVFGGIPVLLLTKFHSAFLDALAGMVEKIIGIGRLIVGKIETGLEDIWQVGCDAVGDLASGLWQGIADKAGDFLEMGKNVIHTISLGMLGSPEYATYYIGQGVIDSLGRGLREGIARYTPMWLAAIRNIWALGGEEAANTYVQQLLAMLADRWPAVTAQVNALAGLLGGQLGISAGGAGGIAGSMVTAGSGGTVGALVPVPTYIPGQGLTTVPVGMPTPIPRQEVHNHYNVTFTGPVLGDRYQAEKFAAWLTPYFIRRNEVR
jgi:succinate dehydrogenase hydrophobic anchor subunit